MIDSQRERWPGRETDCGVECVRSAPIVVHCPSAAGGRRVTVHRRGRDEILGTACSDHDLVVFLEALGIPDPDGVLNDPKWLEWRDGPDRLWPTAPEGR